MGLEQARSALEAGLSGDTQEVSGDSAPDTSNELGTTETSTPKPWDLDSFNGPIKYNGKEWSKEDLQKQFLMQSDYTKKTQALAKEKEELNSFKQEKEFAENLRYDLENVRRNPALAAKFKEVYPEKYHEYLDLILGNQTEPQQEGNQNIDPKFLNEFREHKAMLETIVSENKEAKINAHMAEIDTNMSSITKKYPLAVPEMVIQRAMSYNKDGSQLTPDLWDKIGKEIHDNMEKAYASYYKGKVTQQKQASAKAKDVASGGGTPDHAPKKESFKEAQARMIKDLTGR